MTDSIFHKIFLITCTGFRLRQRYQTAVLHLNLWKLPHGRYSPAKHHVSEAHLIGYASYFNKKSNLSSKLISRSKKFTSEQLKLSKELFKHTTTRKQLLTGLTSVILFWWWILPLPISYFPEPTGTQFRDVLSSRYSQDSSFVNRNIWMWNNMFCAK